jgi:transmembrane sensor
MTRLRLPLAPLRTHATDRALREVWDRIDDTRHRRGRSTWLQVGAAAALAASIAAVVLIDRDPPAPDAEWSTLALSDRSKVDVEEKAEVRVASHTSDAVRLVLDRGKVRLSVDPEERRRWTIDCGPVQIEVVGTIFSVMRSNAAVEVDVERGLVRVTGPGVDRLVPAGDRIRIDLEPASPAKLERTEVEAKVEPKVEAVERRDPPPRARRPAPKSEPVAKGEAAETPKVEPFEAILSRADAARSRGEVDEAIRILESLLAAHPSDPQAPVATFTLGRLYASRGDHGMAADAFDRCVALVPSALVEGAMARAFESRAKAGDRIRAASAARRYLERFPSGRFARAAQAALEGRAP